MAKHRCAGRGRLGLSAAVYESLQEDVSVGGIALLHFFLNVTAVRHCPENFLTALSFASGAFLSAQQIIAAVSSPVGRIVSAT